MVKEPCLLGHKPFSELIVSAISQSTDEMRNFVVGHSLLELILWNLGEVTPLALSFLERIVNTFNIESMLSGVFVDLFSHVLLRSFFIRIIQKLDLFQHLKPRNSDVLKLVNSDDVMGCFVVERDQTILSVRVAHVLIAIHVDSGLSILKFFLVDNHLFKFN